MRASRISRATWFLALAVIAAGTLAAGTVTPNDEDLPAACFVLPALVASIACAWVLARSADLRACLLLALSPLLGLGGAWLWTAAHTAVFQQDAATVETSAWNAQAHEGNRLPEELCADAVCVYHWAPWEYRLALLEDGEPELLVEVERKDGRWGVADVTRVSWASSGRGGVWPNR